MPHIASATPPPQASTSASLLSGLFPSPGLSSLSLSLSRWSSGGQVGASPDKIRALANDAPTVRLALSLHAASQPLRLQLIPSATTMPALCEALDEHRRATRAGLMIEYLLIDGVNDQPADADALAAFCLAREHAAGSATAKGSGGYVNLIPFNPTSAGDEHGYAAPSDEAVGAFHSRLRHVHGVHALIRWTSAVGRDANGGCGQLVVSL